jgi:hypothetical protein
MKNVEAGREGGTIVNIEIVKLRDFSPNKNSVDVAFPVFALECEVHSPIENGLDAYETAALKLISINLSAKGIADTLNVTLSLAEQFLSNLNAKKYIAKKFGTPWEITEDGSKYLSGILEERLSDNSKFGYIFVSAIRKDVLQYFYEGDTGKITRSDVAVVKNKITLHNNENEEAVFESGELIKGWKLEQAYRRYLQNRKLENRLKNEGTSIEEAQADYTALESVDEADYDEPAPLVEKISTDRPGGGKVLVRRLKREPVKLYLQMRLVFSPELSGGFTVESPLDLSGIDNEFFLRQVQWMRDYGKVFFKNEKLSAFLKREAVKFGKGIPDDKKDKSVFILERLPLLAAEKERYREIYSDVGEIYELMHSGAPALKNAVINDYHTRLLEALFYHLFNTVQNKDTMLQKIKKEALAELKFKGEKYAIKSMTQNIGLNTDDLFGNDIFKNAVSRLDSPSRGNSLKEKLINLLVIYYYQSPAPIKKFIVLPELKRCVDIIRKLDDIRNRAAHYRENTPREITEENYNYYTEHVFNVAKRLLESLKEESLDGKE